jgi:hypothetical protein
VTIALLAVLLLGVALIAIGLAGDEPPADEPPAQVRRDSAEVLDASGRIINAPDALTWQPTYDGFLHYRHVCGDSMMISNEMADIENYIHDKAGTEITEAEAAQIRGYYAEHD